MASKPIDRTEQKWTLEVVTKLANIGGLWTVAEAHNATMDAERKKLIETVTERERYSLEKEGLRKQLATAVKALEEIADRTVPDDSAQEDVPEYSAIIAQDILAKMKKNEFISEENPGIYKVKKEK